MKIIAEHKINGKTLRLVQGDITERELDFQKTGVP